MFGFFGAWDLTTDLVGPLGERLARIPSQIGLVVSSSSPTDGLNPEDVFSNFSATAGLTHLHCVGDDDLTTRPIWDRVLAKPSRRGPTRSVVRFWTPKKPKI